MQNESRLTGRLARTVGGFTLIELMIVVVIIGALAAIAYPSYRNQVLETRRADGQAALLDTAQRLERCYTRFASYTNANCNVALPADSPEAFYQVTAAPVNAGSFTLAAVPQGDQANDAECGTLRLSSDGTQGADGDPDDCW